MPALAIEGLHAQLGSAHVLKGIDLAIDNGEFIVLVGPSGCGKSTLLNVIAGLEKPSAGRVRISGRDVTSVAPKDRDIAMVFQSYALYPAMTVRGNITFGMECRGIAKAERHAAVERVAKLLQIEALLDRRPSELSGGQRQRVAMGRALVRDPVLFLFDEPLSNLDAKLRVEMRMEIKRLHRRLGTTIVYVTHDQVEAMTLATRIAVMHGGEILQFGTPQSVYDQPANLFVAGFMGSPPMNILPVRLQLNEGAVMATVDDPAVQLPLPRRMSDVEPWLGKPALLGIRPECISLGSHGPVAVTAAIEMTEPTGAETMVVLALAGTQIVARVDAGRASPSDRRPILARPAQGVPVRRRDRPAFRLRRRSRMKRFVALAALPSQSPRPHSPIRTSRSSSWFPSRRAATWTSSRASCSRRCRNTLGEPVLIENKAGAAGISAWTSRPSSRGMATRSCSATPAQSPSTRRSTRS